MKGVLGKKILKMMGIVFGVVLGVAGSVFGVMAAMGKFDTPVVYPTVLRFEDEEQVVIEGATFNPEEDWKTQFEKDTPPQIQSLILKGANPKFKEHSVNKTQCYVWFEDAESSRLITLCNKNGKPLTPNANLRYLVDCNKPIYYMINQVDENEETDGKVLLYARSTNETLSIPENPMTIWIDRKVNSVFVDYAQSNINKEELKQEIHLGINMGFDFKYVVDTPLSLKPISGESEKEVEIYYITTNKDTDYGTDYFRVTPESCDDNNTSSPVANILECVNGTYRFQATNDEDHQFILAVFPTYQSKIDYYASIENLGEFENPNFHKTQNMLTTKLDVLVDDIEINKAGLSGDNIILDLYSTTNFIYLDNESEDNDLGLYMKKGVAPNQIDDYTRFEEVTMNGFVEEVWSSYAPTFSVGDINWVKSLPDAEFVGTGIYIAPNHEIIDYIYDEEDSSTQYFCNNGVAVRDTKGTPGEKGDDEYKLLRAGSYLNFYIQTINGESETYEIANFDYTAKMTGEGRDKKWQITAKELPNLVSGQKLCIAILVVNDTGEFHYDLFFDAIPVALDKLELSYNYKDYNGDNVEFTASTATANFSITFDETETYYPSLSFENVLKDIKGTYDNFVYVVKSEEVSKDSSIVNLLDRIQYQVSDGVYYYVVGYTNEDGEFVNAIKVNDKVSKENQSCSIYMLQLNHGFGEKVEDYINSLLDGEPYANGEEVNIATEKFVKLEENAITVNAEYVLNANLLTYTHGDISDEILVDSAAVYENTAGYELSMISSNADMLEKVSNFYDLNETFVKVTSQYSARLTIDSLDLDTENGRLVVSYHVGSAFEKDVPPLSVDIWFEIGEDVHVDLGSVTILNGSPDLIALRYNENEYIELAESMADVSNANYIVATLGCTTSDPSVPSAFTYTFKIISGANEFIINPEELFNSSILFENKVGFQDRASVDDGENTSINKGQTLSVYYNASDSHKAIFNTDAIVFDESGVLQPFASNLIGKEGEIILAVTIGETTGYIKLKTDTSMFKAETVVQNLNIYNVDDGEAYLSDFVKFTYSDGVNDPLALSLAKTNMVNIKRVVRVEYGDGSLIAIKDENGDWVLKKSVEDEQAILTIKDDGSVNDDGSAVGWIFTKTNYYVSLSVTFEVETIAGNLEIQVNFNSSVNIGVTQYWADRTIYEGTEVALRTSETYECAIFEVTQEDDSIVVEFKVGRKTDFGIDFEGGYLGEKFSLSDEFIGDIVIVPFINDTQIDIEFLFTVRPNVIAEVDVNSKLISETNSYGLSSIYVLKTYKTDVVYGEDAESLYTKKVYYTDSTYTQISDAETEYFKVVPNHLDPLNDANSIYSKLKFDIVSSEDNYPILTIDGQTLNIGVINELGAKITRNIKLVYNATVVREDEITIENKYNAIPEGLVFNALKEYEIFASVDDGFELKAINNADGITFDIETNPGYFTITKILNEVYVGDVELVFVYNEIEYTYICDITILPYTPDTKDNDDITKAYSGSNYDLFGGIYTASSIATDANIYKLYATGIKYENTESAENVASTLISNWNEGGSGYMSGIAGPACVITFNEIAGDKLDIFVEFSITYTNGDTYIYYVPLTINNRQNLSEPTYPESETVLTNGIFKFFEGYEKDALEISGLSQTPVDEVYSLTDLKYEAVMIYTDVATEVNFKYDDIKKLRRFEVSNVEGITTTNSTSENLTVELIGYQNNGGVSSYVSRIVNDVNRIVLPSAQQGMFGTLIFKVSTASGNYQYYNIYVYCKNSSVSGNMTHEHNLTVAYYEKVVYGLDKSIENIDIVKTNSESTTYLNLIKQISEDESGVYFSTFKTEFNANTTKVYLYNITSTGNSEDYSECYWQELKDEIVLVDKYFNTITLGLVMNDGVQEYCYGTITIYVQPTNAVAIDSAKLDQFKADGITPTLKYELPNGYFTADVKASLETIECPFGEGWTAEIIGESSVASASNDKITLNKSVSQDTKIYVKYTKDGTVIYADYTYKATRIPQQSGSVKTIGQFISEDSGFNVAINFNSADIKNEFLGTYNKEFTVSVGETADPDKTFDGSKTEIQVDDANQTKITFVGNVLTFPQSHVEQIFKITITYKKLDLGSETRTFTFKVMPGYQFETQGDNKGLSTSNRVKTDTDPGDDIITGAYQGSVLKIENYYISEKLYKFVIGDLVIYTNSQSRLVLTFDEESYVLHDQNKVLGIDASELKFGTIASESEDEKYSYIYFVHSAIDKDITMSISVVTDNTEEKEFAKRSLYITVAKTYSTIQANYLVDDADHENVVSGYELVGVHDNLMTGTRKRLVLINNAGEKDDTADLKAMGFADVGNPNYITFNSNSSAIIKTIGSGTTQTNNIQFNTVAQNTECKIFLYNDAGIETNSVIYTYQIMAGTTVDGLDYSSATHGTVGTNPYVSFILEDEDGSKAYSKKFIVGTMKDAINNSVFTVENFGTRRIIDENGNYTDGAKEVAVGGYRNTIQYVKESNDGNYNLYLTLNNNLVELLIESMADRDETAVLEGIQEYLNIKIGGVNGSATIAENLIIVLSNHKIEENYKETIDSSIYSGFVINLFEDNNDADLNYNNGKFVENGGKDADTATAGYQTALDYYLADSYYIIDAERHEILASETSNDLFEYDSQLQTIQTRAVASDVRAEINFLVKHGDYVIKTVRYNLYIYLNMKFVVNGDETSSLETELVLTNKSGKEATPESFPITKTFTSGGSINAETDLYKNDKTKTTYYKVLAVDLYRLKTQQNSLIIDRNAINITLNSNISGDVLKVTNSEITFYKDYSGEIELKLSASTQNGMFVQYWTIYVTPIIDVDLAKTETSILQTSAAAPFNSQTSVNLINNVNSRASEDVGVVVNYQDIEKFKDYIDRGTITVNYQYRIYTFAQNSGISGLTSKELYDLKDDSEYYIAEGGTTGVLVGHTFSVSLPNVPTTLDVQSYLVTYKVYVNYLGLGNKVEVFYVTYNVINEQRVDHYQYKTSAASDVWYASDDVNVTDRVTVVDTKHYLDLFYYADTYAIKVDGEDKTIFTVTYSGGEYVLIITEKDLSANPVTETTNTYEGLLDGNKLVFTVDADNEYQYDALTHKLTKQGESAHVMETSKYYKDKYSVFESKFSNILEFKNFIDLYLYVEDDNEVESVRIGEKYVQAEVAVNSSVLGYYIKTGEKYVEITEPTNAVSGTKYYTENQDVFKLVEIENGRYGIDLNENEIKWLNNEANEKLCLVVADVETVVLPDFKIYVENSITPFGSAYTIEEMGLSNYFTPGKDWDNKVKIIGIGCPEDNSWVNNAIDDAPMLLQKDYGTIKVPNASGYREYKIYKAIYEGDCVGDYYTTTQEYYYIYRTELETTLPVPSYNGIESYLYSVAYNPTTNGDVVLDLAEAVKVWKMVDNKLINSSDSVEYSDYEANELPSGVVEPTIDLPNKKIYLSANTLSNYKLNNPTAKTYPRIIAGVKAGGVEIKLVIEFALPETLQYYVEENDNYNVEITLPTEITAVESDGTYYLDFASGKLTLDGEEIASYFIANEKEKQLVLSYNVTAEIGEEAKTVPIQVIVYNLNT